MSPLYRSTDFLNLAKLLRSRRHRKDRQQGPSRGLRSLAVESLEQRRLLTATVDSIGLLNGALNSSGVWEASDPTLSGHLAADPEATFVRIDFDDNGDGSPEGSLTMSASGGVFDYDPRTVDASFNSPLGATGIDYRTVELDSVGDELNVSGWTYFPFVYDGGTSASVTVTAPAAQSMNENSSLTIGSSSSNGFTLGGYDPDGQLDVTLTASDGTLAISLASGVSLSQGQSSGASTVEFIGPAVAVNQTLNSLVYTPNSTFTGSDTLSVNATATDSSGGVTSDSTSLAIQVNSSDDGSGGTTGASVTITAPTGQSVNENSSLTIGSSSGNGFTLAGYDSNGQLDVTLTASDGTLAISPASGVTITQGSASGVSTVEFSGPATAVSQTLDSLVYAPNSTFTGSDTLSVNVTATDSSGGVTSDSTSLAIQVNSGSSVTITAPAGQSMNENGSLTIGSSSGNGFTLAGYDSNGQLDVTLTASDGTLTITPASGVTITQGSTSGVATVEFAGPAAAVSQTLDSLVYTPNSTFTGSDTLSVSVTATDSSGGVTTDSASLAIQVNASSSVTITAPAAQSINENVSLTIGSSSGNGFTLAGYDSNGQLDVRVSVSDGMLTITPASGVTITQGSTSGLATVDFSGPASAVSETLDSLVYTPTSTFTGSDTLSVNVTATDSSGGVTSDSASLAIQVNASSSVTITAPAAQSMNENGSLAIGSSSGNGFTLAGYDANGQLDVTVSVSDGTLTITPASGVTITQGSTSGVSTVEFVGPAAAVLQTLDSLSYSSNDAFTGSDIVSVDVTATDSFGGVTTDSTTLAVQVNSTDGGSGGSGGGGSGSGQGTSHGPPTIADFEVGEDGYGISLTGVVTLDPSSTATVMFGGPLDGYSSLVNNDGTFDLYIGGVELDSGQMVSAQAVDELSQDSNTAYAYIA